MENEEKNNKKSKKLKTWHKVFIAILICNFIALVVLSITNQSEIFSFSTVTKKLFSGNIDEFFEALKEIAIVLLKIVFGVVILIKKIVDFFFNSVEVKYAYGTYSNEVCTVSSSWESLDGESVVTVDSNSNYNCVMYQFEVSDYNNEYYRWVTYRDGKKERNSNCKEIVNDSVEHYLHLVNYKDSREGKLIIYKDQNTCDSSAEKDNYENGSKKVISTGKLTYASANMEERIYPHKVDGEDVGYLLSIPTIKLNNDILAKIEQEIGFNDGGDIEGNYNNNVSYNDGLCGVYAGIYAKLLATGSININFATGYNHWEEYNERGIKIREGKKCNVLKDYTKATYCPHYALNTDFMNTTEGNEWYFNQMGLDINSDRLFFDVKYNRNMYFKKIKEELDKGNFLRTSIAVKDEYGTGGHSITIIGYNNAKKNLDASKFTYSDFLILENGVTVTDIKKYGPQYIIGTLRKPANGWKYLWPGDSEWDECNNCGSNIVLDIFHHN